MKVCFLVFVLISSLAFNSERCRADAASVPTKMLLGMYDQAKTVEARQLLETGVEGISGGFLWANAILTQRQTPLLFCAPPKLVFAGSQLIDIVRREVQKDQTLSDAPFGLALLISLASTFPCQQR